ncbi:MAG: beta-N-acetylhexosaminidase [Candidatus Acidiferrales bacterium]
MINVSRVPAEALEKFILGFEGHHLPAEVARLLAEGLAGVILFPRNFSSASELEGLCAEIRRTAGRPVLIGIDQEGGTRFSLPPPFTKWPSAAELGARDDAAEVEQIARGMARELRDAGVNLDFAPMLDLHLQPESPVTEQRSFGADPEKVARLGAAFAHGLAAEHILACAKHFPGHGDTRVDPHLDLPVFDCALDRLRKMELVPFARAARENVPLMMTAHILLPAIDSDTPASLSRRILAEVLREEMGYKGVILADDLGMGAIRNRWPVERAAVAAFTAGSDLALICHDASLVAPALQAVVRAIASGELNASELRASHTRIAHLHSLIS